MIHRYLSMLLMLLLFSGTLPEAVGQGDKSKVLDEVIAVVGEDVILFSDLEAQYQQFASTGEQVTTNTRCALLEELLYQKLLVDQAELDSVVISEAQIQSEMDRRLRFFINQVGSEKKLEEYYQKSIDEIKEEFHDLIKEQLLVQTMQAGITEGIKVTPTEVRDYYNSIPQDSLPYINAEAEIAHIVKKPPISKEEKERVKIKLEGFRERIMKGEDFGTIAYLYSEDPGSAKKNGELGFTARTELVPEFAAVAFNLKKGEVSEIVETEFGYHLIKLIARRGERINVRHILLTPKVSPKDLIVARDYLDSLANVIKTDDTMTFEKAAAKFSDDADTRNNGGKLINPLTGTTRYEMDQLGTYDPSLFFIMDKMAVGDISKAEVMQNPDGTKAYRLVKLVTVTEPHRANLKDDYQRIQEITLAKKKAEAMHNWMQKKINRSYAKIKESYLECEFEHDWATASRQVH